MIKLPEVKDRKFFFYFSKNRCILIYKIKQGHFRMEVQNEIWIYKDGCRYS